MSLAAIIIIILGQLTQMPTTFDLAADFSFRDNPNKVWQYGYSATNSLAPGEFRLDQYAEVTDTVGFWHPAKSAGPGPDWYPYIAFNNTQKSQFGSSNGWAIRPGEVAMEASNSGQYSLVQFTAPAAGTYKVSAQFAGIHFGLSTTDVHVLHNGVSLFDADIGGYGGDPAFHKVQGTNPTSNYSGQVELKAYDTVTFAVGYGKNKTNYGDTTGLFVQVVLLVPTTVSEQSTH
jgi:hypothetical protein